MRLFLGLLLLLFRMKGGFDPAEDRSTLFLGPQRRTWRRTGVTAQLISPIHDLFLERGAGLAGFRSVACLLSFFHCLCALWHLGSGCRHGSRRHVSGCRWC